MTETETETSDFVAAATAQKEDVVTAPKEYPCQPNEEAIRKAIGELSRERLIGNCIVYRGMWCETLDKLERLTIEHEKLKAENSRLSQGLNIRGWWCMPCGGFVGEERELHTTCIYCDRPKDPRAQSKA